MNTTVVYARRRIVAVLCPFLLWIVEYDLGTASGGQPMFLEDYLGQHVPLNAAAAALLPVVLEVAQPGLAKN